MTVHFDGESSSERYLFLHNDDLIRNSANLAAHQAERCEPQ